MMTSSRSDCVNEYTLDVAAFAYTRLKYLIKSKRAVIQTKMKRNFHRRRFVYVLEVRQMTEMSDRDREREIENE